MAMQGCCLGHVHSIKLGAWYEGDMDGGDGGKKKDRKKMRREIEFAINGRPRRR